MSSNNYVPRVTQLDALQLDEEVIEILKSQLIETTKFLSPGFLTPIGPELELILRTLVFNYSLLKNKKSFGQQMLSLKYDENLLSRSKMGWLFGYTVLLKYIKDRLFFSYASNKRAQTFISYVEKFQIIGDFLNLIRFLQTGKNATLIDYILNLEMATIKNIRNQYTDYAWTRELLWHNFIELFGVLIPSLNSSFVRRIIKEKSLKIFRKSNFPEYSSFVNSVPVVSKTTKCAECGRNPILPHFMGCDHVFCHYCLQGNKLDDPSYKCPRCNFNSNSVMRVPSG